MSENEWRPIDSLSKEDGEVLLKWQYEDGRPIYRVGNLFLSKDFHDAVVVRCALDFGDFSATAYSARDDQPMHWKPLE